MIRSGEPQAVGVNRFLCRLSVALALLSSVIGTSAAAQLPLMTPGLGHAVPPQDTVRPPDDAQAVADKARQVLLALDDPAVRAWLLERAAQAPADELAGAAVAAIDGKFLQERLEAIRNRLASLVTAAHALPAEVDLAITLWSLELSPADLLRSFAFVLVFLLVGVLVEHGFCRLTRTTRSRVEAATSKAPTIPVGRTLTRGLIDVLAIGAFALGSIGSFLVFSWHPIVELLVVTLLLVVLLLRLTDVVVRIVLAPRAPGLRLVPLDTPTARLVHGWLMAFATVAAIAFLFINALVELGFLSQSRVLLHETVWIVLMGLLVALVWRTGGSVSSWLRGGGPSSSAHAAPPDVVAGPGMALPLESRRSSEAPTRDRGDAEAPTARLRLILADLWPTVATAFLLTTWLIGALGGEGLAWTMVIMAVVPALDHALRGLVAAAFMGRGQKEPTAETTAETLQRQPAFLPVVQRLVRFLLGIATLFALAIAWGLDVVALAGGTGLLGEAFQAGADIILTLLLADLIWQTVKATIDHKLEELGGPPGGGVLPSETGEGGGAAGPGARARTLLPLIRNFIMVVLLVMVTLIVMSSLGVDIGPLLAGAGVVGIAIGFGAQTLVRDIVAGVFFLLEDAFRVGEYIEVGELRGTVEAMSLRSLRIRHHRGAVHTLPFGEMKSLTNYSRDWIIMKLEFRVPFETDLTKVKKIVKRVGQELLEHPEYGKHILEPVKSQGVRRMEEFNMVVGVKFMTKPGEQWVIRRETYQRILQAFDDNGIRLASRHVEVNVNAPLSRDERAYLASAAAEAAVEQDGAPAPVPDTP